MASVERRPTLGASQHPNTQESNKRLQKNLSEKILRQRTTHMRISRPLANILGNLGEKKRGQRKRLTKGDVLILSLMAEAGYEVDTETWTLVIALNYQNIKTTTIKTVPI